MKVGNFFLLEICGSEHLEIEMTTFCAFATEHKTNIKVAHFT